MTVVGLIPEVADVLNRRIDVEVVSVEREERDHVSAVIAVKPGDLL